jgi:hypothetical protein
MMIRRRNILLLFAEISSLVLLSSASPARADDKSAPAAASQDEMMKAWMAQATPGAEHKALEAAVGSWDVRTKAWMAPGAAPAESAGTSENKMILGGRFLEQRYEGTVMGQPFSGIGVTGYDNYKNKAVATWIDSMSTSVMVLEGAWDKTGKVLTCFGTMNDVVAKKPMKVKTRVTIADADHHPYESWHTGPDGAWSKDLEIHYTRKK